MFTSRYVKVPHEKPMDAEHPDMYHADVTVSYKMTADQLRAQFGLDASWQISGVNEDGGFGPKGYRGLTAIFTRRVGGPKLAMEILAGGKGAPEEDI